MPTYVLGIETSCDETAVAIYHSKQGIIAHQIYSQIKTHAKYGGVVPELASREHIAKITPLVLSACHEAGITCQKLTAIAYTHGPGLLGALLIGAAFAKTLAYSLNVPAIAIHHLEAHLLAARLETPAPDFPFLALLVSGGHSQIVAVRALGDYEVLGDTLDDAAGEAFDKVAKILGLGLPGGPQLEKLALSGNPQRFQFPIPMRHHKSLDFSFSGLKTHTLLEFQKHAIDPQLKADIAYAFQKTVVELLYEKTKAALAATGLKRLVIAGGVGANTALRRALAKLVEAQQIEIYFPRIEYCTDNGAMIAYVGHLKLAQSKLEPFSPAIQVHSRINL